MGSLIKVALGILLVGLAEYLVLDRWASGAAYHAFRTRFSSEYRRLDRRFEKLTEDEVFLGTFETL